MDTLSFLKKVLPETPNYVLHLHRGFGKSKTTWNENYTTLEDISKAAILTDKAADVTVFFAVGSFADNIEISPTTGRSLVKRTQLHAARFKTLCCDLDVGGEHEYQTAKEAAVALTKACEEIKLPQPMLVSSGRGVHCYWPLTKSISSEAWEALSKLLRTALQVHNMELDASKIHDRSMVLRPAGMHHKKDPKNFKEVRVLRDVEPLDPVAIVNILKPYKDKVATELRKTRKKKSGKTSAMDMQAVMSADLTPINLESVAKKCKQIEALVASGGVTDASGKRVKEPMWYASLGLAAFCEDPQDALVQLCGQHKDFDLEDNTAKMEQWKEKVTGATKCAVFKQHCPEGCSGCDMDGKGFSPASLSRGTDVVTMTHPETSAPVTFNLPRGYSVKNGAVFFTPIGSDEEQFVSPYMIYVLDRFTDVDEHRQIAKLLVKFPLEGEKVIDLDTMAIAHGGNEFVKALALRQIYIAGDPRPLRAYLMTYLQELQKSKPIEMYYRHFGWQTDTQFLGSMGVQGQVDDSALVHYDGPIKDYRTAVSVEGKDIKQWVKLTGVFAQPDARYHGLVFLMMAGSPLMRGSGLASLLVNSYSKESGSGKTITARMGLSIWGQPSKLMRTVNDTDNALYKHFGIMHSIGAYIDEITTMDPERLRAFAFTLQEGRERDRVKQSADGFREKVHWCMPLFASSNRDAYEVIGMRYSSEAEKLRILQFTFDKLDIFEDNRGTNLGYEISRFLEANYGFVGPILVKEIMARGGPTAVFDNAYKRFQGKYEFNFTGPERFYHAMMVIADAIGEIMESKNLILFDYQEAVRNGLRHIEYLRKINVDGALNGLDLLFQFLTENANKIVGFREIRSGNQTKAHIIEPAPHIAVARTENAYDSNDKFLGGEMFVNRQTFKKWCAANGVEYRSVLTSMEKEGVRIVEQVRKTLFKGVVNASSSGQTYCFQIDLASHPRLIEANSIGNDSPINVSPRMTAVE